MTYDTKIELASTGDKVILEVSGTVGLKELIASRNHVIDRHLKETQ